MTSWVGVWGLLRIICCLMVLVFLQASFLRERFAITGDDGKICFSKGLFFCFFFVFFFKNQAQLSRKKKQKKTRTHTHTHWTTSLHKV